MAVVILCFMTNYVMPPKNRCSLPRKRLLAKAFGVRGYPCQLRLILSNLFVIFPFDVPLGGYA